MNIKTREGAIALMNSSDMEPFWVSFWVKDADLNAFEIHFPWWITGQSMGDDSSICVALYAKDSEHAKTLVEESFDEGHSLTEWRFAQPCAVDIESSGRFTINREWMVWPE